MLRQKMCYIDLYRGGIKCGNMGHVRLEWDAGRCRFAANLCRMDRQTIVTALMQRRGQEAGTKLKDIPIIHGKGSYQSSWLEVYGDEERMLFEASGGIFGVCVLPQMEGAPARDDFPQGGAAAQSDDFPQGGAAAQNDDFPQGGAAAQNDDSAQGGAVPQSDDSAQGGAVPPVDDAAQGTAETEHAQPVRSTVITQDADPAENAQEQEKTRFMEKILRAEQPRHAAARERARESVPLGQESRMLSDDKWKQLCSIYEVVHPIGAEIDFVKIKPEDFVVLRQEFQGLVRNSFLLHGYYNYNYILLGKYPDKYYIGVPGILHEQERIAASMFGFIGFERADLPGKQGENRSEFGYYMMEVGI